MNTSDETRRRSVGIWIVIAAIFGGSVALWLWWDPALELIGDRAGLRDWVARLGPWGPLVTITLNILQVLVAPIPGQFVGVMNGYLYGVAAGTLYSMVGLVLGTAMAMVLARRYGRPVVERLLPQAQIDRWDDIAGRQGPWFFFLVFLFPFLPDDVTSFLIGLSPLSLPPMLVLVTLGRLPGVLVSSWVGARASELPWWAWISLGGGATGLAWLFWRYQTRLESLMLSMIQRLLGADPRPGPS